MWKILFFIAVLFVTPLKLFSQNVEKTMWALIYKDIKKQNEYSLIKKRMQGVYLLFNPASGEYEIHYSNDINKETKTELENYSEEEKIEILKCDSNEIIKLEDTLIIVDTIGFFSEGQIINQDKSLLIITHKNDNKRNLNLIYIYAVGIRNNNLIISLSSLKQKEILFNYYFDLVGSNIKLQKAKVIDHKMPHSH